VLKHRTQAVIRVSKQFLPHMSALLEHPKVTVHVGDGFAFLQANTATYDIIVTDSSDPVGPAQALFEVPYFELLHAALAPGGHIATQAECSWLHLPLIADLRKNTRGIFAVAEYAYTTIPTYPAGQIGFIVASKEAGRDLRTPLRAVPDTRYYNGDVHRAAFVLPEFARAALEDGTDVTPKFGRAAAALAHGNAQKKRVLLLGSGFVARPAAEFIVRNPANELTIGARTPCMRPASAADRGTQRRARSRTHKNWPRACRRRSRSRSTSTPSPRWRSRSPRTTSSCR
jgi:hypothetical protein